MRVLRVLLLGLLMAASAAGAQTYPDKSRPLKIVVPSGVGDSMDLLSRALAKAITETTGWSVIVDNKPGAEAVIGMMAVKNAAPDGYTMVLATSSSMVLAEHMLPNLPYDPVRDFVPVAGLSKGYLTVNLAAAQPFKSARELIDAARANPGKYSIASSSTTTRLAAEMLQQQAGIKMLWVPFKAPGDAMMALASSQVDVYITDVPTAAPFHKSGKARLLAVSGTSRLESFPTIPTVAEEGVKGYNMTAWYATYLPRGSSPEVAATLRDIVRKASRTPTVKAVMDSFAMEPLELMGDQLTTLQHTDSERWGRAVRAAGMLPN